MMMTRTSYLPAAAIVLLTGAACTEGSVTGAEEAAATTEVRVHGDAPPAANESRSPDPAARSTQVEGSLEVEARVYLMTDAGNWVELTNGTAHQTVDASAEGGFRTLARAEVEARSYQRVRVEFERVEGELSGGIAIDLGGGSARVALDAGSGGAVVVEREVTLAAEAGAVTRLDIDLNASQWAETAASTGLIARGALATAVSVSAH